MLDLSRVVAVLALVLQIGNAGMFFVQAYAPEYAYIVAAVLAGIQAFTARVQGAPER